MKETIEIEGVKCAKTTEYFLVENADVAVPSEPFEYEVHSQFIGASNVFSLRRTPATYKSGAEMLHTTVLVPTTENTGTYLILNDGYDLKNSTFDTTAIAGSDKILVVLDSDKVDRIDQINRGMIEGIVYIDESSIKEMVRALDM
ncbi:hypothetical protein [Agrobacterium tumefaciens]|uniref:hypothetical protein n=1 Tax=Agrobacterium tumefaciens TaxID=358 RepID=UPI00157321D7|nr:hypothetical protein [Agrobacterium tumefaciens]